MHRQFHILILAICALPLALFANEVELTENAESLVEESPSQELSEGIAEEVQQEFKEESIEIAQSDIVEEETVTESEFTGDKTIDEADVGNVPDSTESEMSQEEADAELAAATDSLFTDSTASDSILKNLELDMTTAVIPTESRRIASPYGIRTYRMHRGVDLGLCHGEDRTIVAAFAGTVKLVRNQGRRRGYGKYVILDHGNGLTTLYAHLASWQVKVGDELQAGDTIGVGGNTGRSFGAHLHFEMRYHGLYIDPTTVFNFEEGTFLSTVASIDPAALQTTEDEFQKELSKHRYYKVRRGDCLGKIARKYGISVRRLKQLNHLKGNMIRPGQVLKCS